MQDIGIRMQDKVIFIEKFHDFYFDYPTYPAHPVLFMIWWELRVFLCRLDVLARLFTELEGCLCQKCRATKIQSSCSLVHDSNHIFWKCYIDTNSIRKRKRKRSRPSFSVTIHIAIKRIE
jgi:hypothetical protein